MKRYAYKFFARGAIGAISEHPWPTPVSSGPGAWVESASPLAPCASGVHACRTRELAHWLHEELWIVELDGEQLEGLDCVVAARGRLIQPIEAWSGTGAARFATAARDHAAEIVAATPSANQARLRAFVSDASAHLPHGATALSAFCSAMTVAWSYGGDHFDDEAYRAERAWQSSFIARDLGLHDFA